MREHISIFGRMAGFQEDTAEANNQYADDETLTLRTAADLIHTYMFIHGLLRSHEKRNQPELAALKFFLSRSGGAQLLMALLNAAYNKPPAKRSPGWPFGVLQKLVDISERGLRTLLHDAVEEGHVEKRCFDLDKRYAVYCLKPSVVATWDMTFRQMSHCLNDVLDHYSHTELANVDYATWDPLHTALEQKRRSPVAALKSAVNRPEQGIRR